jgi:glutamate-1-semialdehyde aminotransferase
MAGQIPWQPEFMQAVGPLTRRYGTIWLMDEVVTGFRDGPAGWSGVMGLEPDLTTLGKCVAGGMAAGGADRSGRHHGHVDAQASTSNLDPSLRNLERHAHCVCSRYCRL